MVAYNDGIYDLANGIFFTFLFFIVILSCHQKGKKKNFV